MPTFDSDIRILVVADDHLARAGLAAMLSDQPGCTVVGQVSGPEHAAAGVDVYSPDIVVWDLGWDAQRSLESLDEAQASRLPTVVLVPDESSAGEAWRAGARGVLLRTVDGATLAAALVGVSRGLAVLGPELAPFSQAGVRDLPEGVTDLTPRELEVLALVADGLPNKAIAGRLGISDHTVKFHVNAILSKLGAQSRTEAVTRVMRMGLITL
jgi:DNA-binding NarL/FixJ family response regulator